LPNGPLPDDNYRLTLTGTATIFDTAGNPLDGDANGTGGDDFVHLFTIDRSGNTAPVADAQVLNINEDGNILITLTGSDLDFDGLSYTITGNPSHGSLGALNPGTHEITYTPDPNYNGPDSFIFEVNDGKLGTSSATINLTVDPVNSVPVTNAQAVGVIEGGSVLIVLTGSDLETFPTNLTYTIDDDVDFGTLVQNTSNTFTYTPAPDFSGADSFTFTATDRGDPDGALANAETSVPATVNITVQNTEDPPILDSIADQVTEVGNELALTVTANDADVLDVLTYSLDSAPVGATINPLTGAFSWTPASEFDLPTTVTVRVTDDSPSALFDFKSFDITDSSLVPSADFNDSGQINGFDFLQWQRGFGTLAAVHADGDADYDADVDGADLAVWESQFGQPAPANAAASSSVVATAAAAATYQTETTSQFTAITEETLLRRLPANLFLHSSDVDLRLNFKASQGSPVEETSAEFIDRAFKSLWSAFNEQNADLHRDEFALDVESDLKDAIQSVDEAFTLLADEKLLSSRWV
jgi:hypothetical protein